MFNFKELEAKHQERIARLTALSVLLEDAAKYGDMLQEVNLYMKKIGVVFSEMSAQENSYIPDGVCSQMLNYLPLSEGALVCEVNGININRLHHIANLLKPKNEHQA